MTESIELTFQEGSSDKVYQAEIKEEGNGWVVNFAYGRRGNALTTGTKTKTPVAYEAAKKAYDKLISSKVGKGYKAAGQSGAIHTADKTDSGVRPQLLNEINEDQIEAYILNNNYCAQEKFDGRRKMIKLKDNDITGVNKKGFVVALTPETVASVALLDGPHILDGEDMGDKIMIFDDIQDPTLPYFKRYKLLKEALRETTHLIPVKTAWTIEDKRAMYEELKVAKAEGMVFKLIDSKYKAGRPASGGEHFKCKFYATASCIVLSHSDVKSSIEVGVYKAGTKTMLSVGNVTVYPNQETPAVGSVVEIKYLYWYPDGSLYQPVLLNERDDVDHKECLTSQLKPKQKLEV
jgi:bifunctional non-homologous end joining protein LigD